MKRKSRLVLASIMTFAVFGSFGSTMATAQRASKDTKEEVGQKNGDQPAPEDLPEPESAPIVRDPIFDRQVAIDQLAAAVQIQDANLLADIAVQLAAAEKK